MTTNHQVSSSSSSSSPDIKKDEFRKYLEKTGVMDALTKVLVGLYEEPERPQNAVDYIKRYIGAPQNIDVDALRKENMELKSKLDKLLLQHQQQPQQQQQQQQDTAAAKRMTNSSKTTLNTSG